MTSAATHVDAFLGTPLYMSPEQVRSTREVDQRTDIFALGAILYKLLTGRTPFVGGSVPELCAAILTTTPPPIRKFRPDVPPELEATIAKCLEKNPADRFASASELATALARFDGYRGAPMPLVRTVPLSMPQKAAPAVSEAASVASVDIADDDSLVPTSGAEARSSLGPGPKALLAAGAILGLLAGTLHSLQRASEAREEALRGGGVDAAGAEGNAGGAATEPSTTFGPLERRTHEELHGPEPSAGPVEDRPDLAETASAQQLPGLVSVGDPLARLHGRSCSRSLL